MKNGVEKILNEKLPIDLKSFLRGISIVLLIYLILYFLIVFYGENSVKQIEEKLSFHIAEIENSENADSSAHHPEAAKHHTSPAEKIETNGLLEDTSEGMLPIIRKKDGLTSFEAYRTPFSITTINKPVVAFVIDDFGLSKEISEMALQILPKEISFALSPYANMPYEWGEMAREKQHELWLKLPFGNNNDSNIQDAGPNAIMPNLGGPKNIKNFHLALSQSDFLSGSSGFTDESFLNNQKNFEEIIDENFKRGLGYLELNPDSPKKLSSVGLKYNAPFINSDLVVYKMTGPDHSFDALEKIAHEKGYAIAVIPCYPETIKNLAIWLMKVAQNDYIIAPISFMYDAPMLINSNDAPSELYEDEKDPITPDLHEDNQHDSH